MAEFPHHRLSAQDSGDTDYPQLGLDEQARLLSLQQTILEAVALGRNHRDIIEQVCLLEEQLLPNAVASVMLLDEQGLFGVYAAPSIPPAGAARLTGLRPGPGAGSCGNAIHSGEPVFVDDVLADPRWSDLRQLAIDFGLKSCWSMPVRSPGGAVIGTFALTSFEHRMPSPFHRRMLEVGAFIVGIVLERRREHDVLRHERDFVNTIFDTVGSVIAVIDGNGAIVRFNRAAERYTGYRFDEVAGRPFFWRNFHTTEQAADVERRFAHSWQGDAAGRYESYWVHRDGSQHLFEWTNTLLFDDRGHAEYLVAVGTDITERKRSEEALQLAAGVFENTQEAIIIVDRYGHIIDANDAFLRTTGYGKAEVAGKPVTMLHSRQDSKPFYRTMWTEVKKSGHWSGEIQMGRKDGHDYPALLQVSAITDEHGQFTRFVAVFTDISVMKRQEAALERLAHYDALTGLPNRVLLADRMQVAVANARRTGNLMVLAYLDLDNFKPVNDRYGHDVGDRLLVEIARRVTAVLRESDTVARLGGDEFVILLPAVGDMDECDAIVARVRDAIGAPVTLPGDCGAFSIAASIGIAFHRGGDEEAESLLRRADQAMYYAKRSGRGRIQVFGEA